MPERPVRSEATAMVRVIPSQQGELDGFCGLYSIVNGCGALWPDSMDDARRLEFTNYILKAIGPEREAGMRKDGAGVLLMQMMLAIAVRFSHRRLPNRLQTRTPFQRKMVAPRFDHWWDDLAGCVGGEDFVAIIGLSKPYAHWTCITEMNTNRALLQDSDGAKEIRFHDIGYSATGKPVEVDWRQVFVLERYRF